MNVYDDYGNFIEDCDYLIKKLKEIDSPIMITINDVLKVLDYVYEQYLAGDKIEDELIDIFDIGFGYFSNVMIDVINYYKDYFKENIDILNYYAKLIVYDIYVNDFKCYLDTEELLNPERKVVIDKIKENIDQILKNRLPYSQETIEKFEGEISSIMPYHDNFKPVYSVFLMITEELNIF